MALTQNNILSRLRPHFTSTQSAELAKILADIQGDTSTVATAFNTAMTKLNSDAGVTDTNYAGVTLPNTGI